MVELSYSPDIFNLSDFNAASSTEVGDDEFSTTARFPVEEGESVLVGRGTSENPLQAEGNIEGDLQDSGGSSMNGQYRLVALNPQNNIANNGVIARGTISELRETRPNSLDGDLQTFVDKEIRDPFSLGLQVRLDSGTATYSQSNSNLKIRGFRGEQLG
jgi:hypothetical protein